MKRKGTIAIAVSALALTGCVSGPPEPLDYINTAEWDHHIQEVGLVCDNNEWREYPLLGDAAAECRDENGADILRVMYHDNAELNDRVNEVRRMDAWHDSLPAILVGPNWLVQCSVVSQCADWQQGIGGELRESPEY